MAKKHFGTIITLAAIAGAAAAGITYFLQYKSFHKELDEDFHDFEDDFDEFDDTDDTNSSRNYVSLNPEHKPADGASEAGGTGDGKAEITDEAADEKSRDGAPAGEQAPVPSATVTVEETVE